MIFDRENFQEQSLLLTTTPFNLSQETSVTGFEIGGVEPDTSKRRILFEVDGKIFKFEGNNLIQIDCDKTADSVLEFGNSVQELLQVTDISEWCGKIVYPIIALQSDLPAAVKPTISLGVKVKSFNDIFQKAELSPIFELGEKAKFLSVTFEKAVSGGGTANLQVRLRQENIWSAFMSVEEAANQICQAVQLKANFSVTSTSGTSSAAISNAEINFVKFSEETAATTSTIYLKPVTFSENLSVCYLTVFHAKLYDCELKAFVSYDELPLEFEGVLGTGTGETQNFTLESGIDLDTLEIFVAGVKTFNFTFNAAENNLSLIAEIGAEISAKYKYNLAAENWQEMELQFTTFDENFDTGLFVSRFVDRLEVAEKSKVAKVKIVAKVLQGSSTQEVTAIGGMQFVALGHKPKVDTITCTADYFFDENNLLKIKANAGTKVQISYDWEGETLSLNKFYVAFSL